MAFFEDVFTTIFGGRDTSAQELQAAANREATRRIDVGTQQARQDILGLFPQGDIQRNLGFQGALDVFGQTIPAQTAAFQAGNIGAQQNLLTGLPQFQQAILGGPVDLSALQPTTVPAPTGFAQQQLPFFGGAFGGRVPSGGIQSGAPGGAGVPGAAFTGGAFPTGAARDTSRDPRFIPGGEGGTLSAQDLDTLQKFGSLASLGGPIGSLANFVLGQFARTQANQAFPGQEPIGFFEDITQPDILGGSPFEIQQTRQRQRLAPERARIREGQRAGRQSTRERRSRTERAFTGGRELGRGAV